MTIVEGIIVGGIVALFTGFLGVVLGGKKKVTQDDFDRHKDAQVPHPLLPCSAHTEKFNNMERSLASIDTKVGKIEDKLDRVLDKD